MELVVQEDLVVLMAPLVEVVPKKLVQVKMLLQLELVIKVDMVQAVVDLLQIHHQTQNQLLAVMAAKQLKRKMTNQVKSIYKVYQKILKELQSSNLLMKRPV